MIALMFEINLVEQKINQHGIQLIVILEKLNKIYIGIDISIIVLVSPHVLILY